MIPIHIPVSRAMRAALRNHARARAALDAAGLGEMAGGLGGPQPSRQSAAVPVHGGRPRSAGTREEETSGELLPTRDADESAEAPSPALARRETKNV